MKGRNTGYHLFLGFYKLSKIKIKILARSILLEYLSLIAKENQKSGKNLLDFACRERYSSKIRY
jgi:hypothetical protein